MNILETLKESIVVERKIKQRGTDQFFLRKWHLPSQNLGPVGCITNRLLIS